VVHVALNRRFLVTSVVDSSTREHIINTVLIHLNISREFAPVNEKVIYAFHLFGSNRARQRSD
jgi:hypothetical protein